MKLLTASLILIYLISPDAFILFSFSYLLLLLAICYFKKLKLFVIDWLFFYMCLITFNALRGTAFQAIQHFDLPVYSLYIIKFESWFTPGTTLAQLLQQATLSHGFFTSVLTKLCAAVYASHFLYFLLVGFYLWLAQPKLFTRFKYSILACSYCALVFFILLPTTPPWLAAKQGLIAPVNNTFLALMNSQFEYLVMKLNTHPVAAMPSLHIAYPFICFLYLRPTKARMVSLGYLLLVCLAVVLLGAHYIGDILAGMLLSSICYFLFRNSKAKCRSQRQNGNKTLAIELIKTLCLGLLTHVLITNTLSI